MNSRGLSVPEVLIALLVIALAFTALLVNQLSSLQVSARSRAVTEIKAAGNRQLEEVTAILLSSDEDPVDPANNPRLYWFSDYYYACTGRTPPAGFRTLRISALECAGSTGSDLSWTVSRLPGDDLLASEGQLFVTVNSVRSDSGAALTLTGQVSCYDIFPSPTKTAPEPCPEPTQGGS